RAAETLGPIQKLGELVGPWPAVPGASATVLARSATIRCCCWRVSRRTSLPSRAHISVHFAVLRTPVSFDYFAQHPSRCTGSPTESIRSGRQRAQTVRSWWVDPCTTTSGAPSPVARKRCECRQRRWPYSAEGHRSEPSIVGAGWQRRYEPVSHRT